MEADVVQDGLLLFVGKAHVLELQVAANCAKRNGTVGVFVLRSFVKHLARALQSGDSLRNLRTDADDLEERSCKISQEHRVGEEATQRQLAGKDLARAHEHDD